MAKKAAVKETGLSQVALMITDLRHRENSALYRILQMI